MYDLAPAMRRGSIAELTDIVKRYFSILLTHIDRNFGMFVAKEVVPGVDLQDVWLYLLGHSFEALRVRACLMMLCVGSA